MFEKRKAYIEFLGSTVVTIVNPFRSKTLDLKKSYAIDLVTLKVDENSVHKEMSGFYAVFMFDEEQKKFDCAVNMRTSERRIEEIGRCDLYDNKKTFAGSVWIKK